MIIERMGISCWFTHLSFTVHFLCYAHFACVTCPWAFATVGLQSFWPVFCLGSGKELWQKCHLRSGKRWWEMQPYDVMSCLEAFHQFLWNTNVPKASLFYFLQKKKKKKNTSFRKAYPMSFCITRIVFDVLQSAGDCHGGILLSTSISGGLATS